MASVTKIIVDGITYSIEDSLAKQLIESKLDAPINNGSVGQILVKTATATEWQTIATSVTNYNDLTNKPVINGQEVTGSITISYDSLSDKPKIPSIDGLAQIEYVNNIASQKADKSELFSKSYNDLTDKPTLFSGNYNDLINKPVIPSTENLASKVYVETELGKKADRSELFSKSYNDLTDKPTLFSGSYTDLTNKPTLFSGNYNDLTDKPTIPSIDGLVSSTDLTTQLAQKADKTELFSGSYNDLTDKPTIPSTDGFATTADLENKADRSELFSKSYNDLTDKPVLFSGSYNDLTDKPDIPNTDNLVDKDYVDSQLDTKADKDELFSGNYNDLTGKPSLFSGSYNDLTNKPELFSGSYDDLTHKPELFSKSYTDLTDKPSINGQPLVGDITISTQGTVPSYTAGNGINIENNSISVNTTVVATKGDIPTSVSQLINDNSYITFSEIPVTSVNGKTGDVTITANDIGALSDTTVIPSKLSQLTNDTNFVNKSYVDEALANFVPPSSDDVSTDLQVSGAGSEAVNGLYKLLEQTAEGRGRVWKHTVEDIYIHYMESDGWVIQDTPDDLPMMMWYNVPSGDVTDSWEVYAGTAPAPMVVYSSNNTTGDSVKYTAGDNITISADNVISATNTTYTNGEGLNLNGTTFSIDWTTVATPMLVENSIQDVLAEIPSIEGLATKEYVDEAIANIESSGGSTSGSDIIVSGAGDATVNGTYKLTDLITETGNPDYTDAHKRVWKKEDAEMYIFLDIDTGGWLIATSRYYGAGDALYGSNETNKDNPLDCTWCEINANQPVPTLTQASGGGSGNGEFVTKAEFDETIGDINTILDDINGEVL